MLLKTPEIPFHTREGFGIKSSLNTLKSNYGRHLSGNPQLDINFDNPITRFFSRNG